MRNHHASGGDKRFLSDLRVFQDCDVHADDRPTADDASLHNSSVADRDIVFQNAWGLAAVDHAIILDAGARAHDNWVFVLIGSQDRSKPDACVVPDRDIADDHGGGGDEGLGGNLGSMASVFDDHESFTSKKRAAHDI